MTVLTVKKSKQEEKKLARRDGKSVIGSGSPTRPLLRKAKLESGSDLLEEMKRSLGDSRLRIKNRR